MRPTIAITVFFSLMLSALFLGYVNYATAKEKIIEDVNQALAKTVLCKKPDKITIDTLHIFKSNLQISQLKETSYLSLCTDEPSRISFCSDTISFKTEDERLYIRAYPNCSRATIFSVSEQTLPEILFLISLLWGMFSTVYLRKKDNTSPYTAFNNQVAIFGNLFYSASSNQFYDEKKEVIYFTPMQLSLMKMLMASENKRLSVDEICHSLWPGKTNAKESLYTLVRRLKPIVERNSNVRIVAEKGGYYVLSIKTDD